MMVKHKKPTLKMQDTLPESKGDGLPNELGSDSSPGSAGL